MAIYRREHVAPYLRELDTYYQGLRRTLEGAAPTGDLAHHYHANPEQFATEFREVDIDHLLYQVAHFRAAVEYLKTLKKHQQKPVGG